jgi:hypothetical protein
VIVVCAVLCVAIPLLIWYCRRARSKKSLRHARIDGVRQVTGSNAHPADSAPVSINDLVRSLVAMQSYGYDHEPPDYENSSNFSMSEHQFLCASLALE